ncbi:sigma-54 dependent transcriptional regulator [Dechloromonas sp. CZR5]|uniref:sigma-54-dependent transcriptional regulator n=1 Tax=Dechloromonas sp. CZR5 TaxID=2608630 RepID=UPI00123D93EF|nr:sigma-54 dependent transcriptional regulator [Dechloromonas sp. CZR5]
MKKLILVVDDDRVFNQLLVEQIGDMGLEAVGAGNWAEASRILAEREPDLVFLDFKLPDAETPQLVEALSSQFPVIVLTGYGSIRNAVSLIQAGAVEYLTKPVSLDELEITIRRELANAELRSRNAFYQRQLESRRPGPLVGTSKAMEALQRMIEAVAPTDATVLIQGESGTGKEMVAQAIHEGSVRAGREMVTIDGGTLQETLFESELFGHERGAFTGADRQKKGLIEEAAGSTLFLDEIGETSPANQAKLLRVLETSTFRRVGGAKTLKADVRFVVATNRDLAELSQVGSFRSDLYFRLASFVIQVPPLRERRDDIPLLAMHFLQRFSRGIERKLTAEAQKLLVAYDWPGNVRELRNLIERAAILAGRDERIRPEHFGPLLSRRDDAVIYAFEHQPKLADVERECLRQSLIRHAGNRAQVAAALGISERNIYRLIKLYELDS